MTRAPAAVIDALNGLLEAETDNIFHKVGEGSPYLDQATEEVRRPLAELDKLSSRHSRELARLIEAAGGVPKVSHRVRPEEQYLSFLSIHFLLPKLVGEKELIVTRYANARRTIGNDHPEVLEIIDRIEAEQRVWLDILAKVAFDVTNGRYTAGVHKPRRQM